MSAEAVAVVGSAVAVLAVLVPLMLTLHNRQAEGLAEVRRELGELRQTVAAQGERLAGLEERVAGMDTRLARIEGAVLGPWRPDPPVGETEAS